MAGPQQISDVASLGRLIRQERQAREFTLEGAAGLAGVGVRFLLELEHGKETASLGKALQVLHRMGLEVWVAPRGTPPWKDEL